LQKCNEMNQEPTVFDLVYNNYNWLKFIKWPNRIWQRVKFVARGMNYYGQRWPKPDQQ
jgi:hypothetical protein